MNRTSITIACAVMCVSLRGSANPTATQAAAEADAKAQAGDFIGAAAKFLEAYAAENRPAFLCNVGVAYYKAKTELSRAQLFLGRCIERGSVLDAKYLAAVHAAQNAVEAALHAGHYTPIDISVEPSTARVEISAFTAAEGFVGSRAIWLPYGTHQLTFSADGFISETRDVEASTSRSVSIQITLQRKPIETNAGSGTESGSGSAADTGSAAVGSAGEAGSGSAIVVPPPPIHTGSSHASKVPAIVATAVSAALVVGATYTFHNASKRADIASAALDPDTFHNDKDYVSKQNTYTIVMASLGVVGAGLSGYLWYRALHETSMRVEVNGTGANVSVGGRF